MQLDSAPFGTTRYQQISPLFIHIISGLIFYFYSFLSLVCKQKEKMDPEHQKKETATTTENSSFRSSVSSFDSNYDHAAPLELGLLINELQTSLVEQNEEGKEATPAAVEGKMEEEENIELTTQSIVKREEKIIVGYEIDHGISNNTDRALKKSTSLFTTANSAANLIVLNPVDAKNVKINTLTPREQENAGMIYWHSNNMI